MISPLGTPVHHAAAVKIPRLRRDHDIFWDLPFINMENLISVLYVTWRAAICPRYMILGNAPSFAVYIVCCLCGLFMCASLRFFAQVNTPWWGVTVWHLSIKIWFFVGYSFLFTVVCRLLFKQYLPMPRGYKTFTILISAEHKIYPVNKR